MRSQAQDTHKQHSVRYLVFANSTTQNDHPSFFRVHGQIVQPPDVSNDIDDQSWVFIRVEIQHVTQGAICESGTEYWDIVL